MPNVTIAIEENLLRAARVKAVLEGTSVNQVCREALERYVAPEAAPPSQEDAVRAFRKKLQDLAAKARATMPPGPALPPYPSRQAMYDEILAERMPTLWAAMDKADAEHAAAGAAAKPQKP
jgi:plasmid stability protein